MNTTTQKRFSFSSGSWRHTHGHGKCTCSPSPMMSVSHIRLCEISVAFVESMWCLMAQFPFLAQHTTELTRIKISVTDRLLHISLAEVGCHTGLSDAIHVHDSSLELYLCESNVYVCASTFAVNALVISIRLSSITL